jgi:uncharacterized protein YxeA
MSKKARREAAKKKKQKNVMIIIVCIAVVAAIAAFFIYNSIQQGQTRVFTAGEQTVSLHQDGKFAAQLAHNVTKRGTYTEEASGGLTMVTFYQDEAMELGIIQDNVLYLPDEWDDGHGHGTRLPLTKGPQQVISDNQYDHDYDSDHEHDHIFASGDQIIILGADGNFTAELEHDVSRSGTYTDSNVDGVTTVSFVYDNTTAVGTIENNVLSIPEEWDDGHGHGTSFVLVPE